MNNYDVDNLSKTEVAELIKALKEPVNEDSFSSMYQQLVTALPVLTTQQNQAVIDPGNNIQYVFHVKRSRFENRYSIHLRFKSNNIHLVRLDIGMGHLNPDGTRIDSDHIHFYVEPGTDSKHFGMALETSDFPVISTFIDAFDAFLRYTNIQLRGGENSGV